MGVANLLTGLRLLAAPAFAFWMARGDTRSAAIAAALIVVAIASDLIDGPLARRMGAASAFGRAFDHTTDFVFISAGLCAGALRGAFPWLLPLSIAIAFGQYVVDSYWLHRERELRMSALGRLNGTLYFFPLCGDLLSRLGVFSLLGLQILEPAVLWLAWSLVATTLLSIVDRALALTREGLDSLDARTTDQSPR